MSATPASHTAALLDSYGFDLDGFQRSATDALDAGRSVLVSAPTGAGKTVVAEYAVADALDRGLRAFYTTPIKALSNQKYGDLRARHGAGNVGLLTGDNSIDGDAPVVVMTTEVLRNMIYAGRSLDDLAVVVLDEVHYLQDSFRGPVWEEVIVHLPEHVQLVCLSATVSNAHDIGDWLGTVRGPTDVVIEEHRPVELANTYLVGDKSSDRLHLVDTLIAGRPNPEGNRFDVESDRTRDRTRKGGRGGGRPRRRWYTPNRLDVLDVLEADRLLPAIVFIFSRAGCDDAVRACLDAGVRLTTPEERGEIRRIAEEHLTSLTAADLEALKADRWLAGLEAGIAAHHAGHVPPFKEAVEACFSAGLAKVVFATETLALGVNMPARAVVIEKMTKFNGERREFLTPAQYTQLTGRAGRRGIDDHGTAIVLWSPFISFGQIAGLAGSRSFVLRSAFRPTYNMAANLVRRHEHDDARRLLNQSLAQYQADKAVVVLERRLRGRRQALEAAEEASRCDLGDVAELRELVHASAPRRVRRQQVEQALSSLRPGDVVATADQPRVAVLSVAFRKGGAIRAKVVTPDRHVHVVGIGDFDFPPRRMATVDLPVPYLPEDSDFRREVAARLAATIDVTPARGRGHADEVDHPVASCPDVDAHLRAFDRAGRLRREVGELTNRIENQTGTIGLQFEQVLTLLDDWGYVDGWSLTGRGELLAGVYHEVDLVVAEAIASGCFDDLDAPELAAVASVLVYEHRAPGPAPTPDFPSRRVRDRADVIEQLARRLQLDEQAAGLPMSRGTDPGFCRLAHEWCAGSGLAALLDLGELDLTGGDFVRTIRQLVDLVRQIGQLAPDAHTRATARRATGALERGVVSASAALASADDGDDDVFDDDPAEDADA